MRRARVSDVAERAGVSTATVSRVLNEPEKVSAATRERVLAAVDALNFVKSATAVSLKAQQSHNILVVVSNVGNIYYSEIFQGLQNRAEQAGYNLIITTPNRQHDSVLERLRQGRVDGVVLLDGYRLDDDDYAFLRGFYQTTPPVVGFSEKPGVLQYPHIYIDNYTAAFQLTKYLIAKGHRQIGHVAAPKRLAVHSERISGFRDAMAEAGLTVSEDDVYESNFTKDDGRKTARMLLERGRMPTAIFCSNDEIAMGMISEMVLNGKHVPDDISIVGFDDCILADVYSPPLTTVRQPRAEIGVAAMELLLDTINDPSGTDGRVVELEVTFVERASVAPPRGTAENVATCDEGDTPAPGIDQPLPAP